LKKDYFEIQQERNKSILLQLATGIWKGLLIVTSFRVEKNLVGDGWRLTAFFSKKGK
jgi:hypothetical protein